MMDTKLYYSHTFLAEEGVAAVIVLPVSGSGNGEMVARW